MLLKRQDGMVPDHDIPFALEGVDGQSVRDVKPDADGFMLVNAVFRDAYTHSHLLRPRTGKGVAHGCVLWPARADRPEIPHRWTANGPQEVS